MKTKILLILIFTSHHLAAQFDYERSWGTYIGNALIGIKSQEVDSEGNTYLGGGCNSGLPDGFITPNAFQSSPAGYGFIIKINSLGNVVWGTYIDGIVCDIDINIQNNQNEIVIMGYAAEIDTEGATVIASPDAYEPTKDGLRSFYLLKLDTDGNRIWGTYYNTGGIGISTGTSEPSIAVDHIGDIYFSHQAGYTTLGTEDTFQPTPIGTNPCAITKFSANGHKVWTSYYGINGSYSSQISVNSTGLFVRGITKDCFPYNNPNTYFATTGANQPTNLGSCFGAYLSKFDFNGQRLWSTYFKFLNNIQADEGSVYVTTPYVSNPNLITAGTFQQDGDISSAYLGKFDDFGQLVWGTYIGLGGLVAESTDISGLQVDLSGNVYLFGKTKLANSIATTDGFLIANPSPNFGAGYAMKFNSAGQRLWGTYYGGEKLTHITGLKITGATFYISGITTSETNIATVGSLNSEYLATPLPYESRNMFLARFEKSTLSTTEKGLLRKSIYPNPNNGNFTISNLDADSYIEIYDAVGKKVYGERVLREEEISLQKVSKGIYFAKIQNGNKIYKTEKIIIN